jgi:SAM-dependent methyltransferase
MGVLKHAIKTIATRIMFPARYAAEQEERRLEQMMGFYNQYSSHRQFQMGFLQGQGLAPQHHLLEIGCGPLTLGIPVIKYLDVGCYTGIDVRPLVVDEAHNLISRQKLGAKNPRIVHTTTFGREELGNDTFDFIVAFSVLYHLDDPLVAQLMQQVVRRLSQRGVCYANVNTWQQPSRWLEFPFLQRPLSFYSEMAQQAGLQTEFLGLGKDFGLTETDIACLNHYLAFRASKTR